MSTTSKMPGLAATRSTSSTTKSASTSSASKRTASTSTSGLPKLSSKTTSMPALSTRTSVSNIATSTTTWDVPTITPPSADNNPNVWRSEMPSGLVFIVVGSICMFLFMIFLLVLLVKKLIAKRNAKKSIIELDTSSSSDGGYYGYEKLNPFYKNHISTSNSNLMRENPYIQNKIPMLYNDNHAHSQSNYDLSDRELSMFSTLNNEESMSKRRSMFLSPTAEVMQFNKKQSHHQRMLSSLNNASLSTEFNEQSYEGQSDQQQQQQQQQQYYQQDQRGENRRHKSTPSAYMETMFEEEV